MFIDWQVIIIKTMDQRKAGIMLNYFTLAFNVLVGLFYAPFLISKIGDGLYGIYSICNSLISFVTLLDFGLSQTYIRYLANARTIDDLEEEHKLNGHFLKLYLFISIIALLLGLIIIYVYPKLAIDVITQEDIHIFRVVLSILLLNSVLSFPLSIFSATLNVYEQFLALKLVDFIMIVIKYIAMILLLVLGFKLISITIVTVLCSLSIQIFCLIYSNRKIKIHFSFAEIEKDLKKEIFKFSIYISLNTVVDFLYSNTDKLILGAVAGATAVSIYSIGVYFSQYFTELSNSISGVFMPTVMRLYKNSRIEEISSLFNRVGRFQMAILFLALGGYLCIGQEFIILWVGRTYKESYIIGLLIMLPSIIPLSQSIGITISRAMNIHGCVTYIQLLSALINILISIPLSISFHGVGSAFGTSISTIIGQIVLMNIFYLKRANIDIKEYWINIVKFSILLITTIFVFVPIKRIFYTQTWLSLIALALLYFVIYALLYWNLISNKYEKKTIIHTISRFQKSILNIL